MKKINILYAFLLLLVTVGCKKKEEIRTIPLPDINVTYDENIYKPGAVIFGTKNYVKIIVGDLNSPIMLASPHDGIVSPSEVATRTHPSAVIVRDLFCTDLTLKMADSLQKLTGLRPHVIINDLTRSKMEPNRAMADAYLTHPEMEIAWNEYHNFLRVARAMIKKNVGKGLYLDMHGHAHAKNRIEVGYLLNNNQVNSEDASLDLLASRSSVFAVGKASTSKFSILLNGDKAYGTLLANNACPSVPSKQDPYPFEDEYFSGGYCTATYGSRNSNDNISAIQLETPGPIIRDNETLRIASSGRMARATIQFMKLNYGLDLMK
jgi:N-formylglutamate amidohydrolase